MAGRLTMIMITRYLKNVALAIMELIYAVFSLKPLPVLYKIDLVANAVFFGDPQETISSRAGKLVLAGDRGLAYYLCRALNWFDKNHCVKNIQEKEGDDELIVLDRGLVIGLMAAGTFYYNPGLFLKFVELIS